MEHITFHPVQKRPSAAPTRSASSFAGQLPMPEDIVGTIIAGRYRLEEIIGSGGFGTVYRTTDVVSGESVALKLQFAGRDTTDRFRKEADIVRALTYNGCKSSVGYLDHGEHEGRVFVVTDMLRGMSLSTAISQSRIKTVAQAMSVLMQVCDAFAELHAFGVIHRDVKPDNIFLISRSDGKLEVKTLDFSVSELSYDIQPDTSSSFIGTPVFIAPELLFGKSVSEQTDIYSMGVLMYEMFTGTRPYQGEPGVILAKAIDPDPPRSPRSINPNIPERIEAIIQVAMAKDPENRFASFDALLSEMAGCLKALNEAVSVLPLFQPPHAKTVGPDRLSHTGLAILPIGDASDECGDSGLYPQPIRMDP